MQIESNSNSALRTFDSFLRAKDRHSVTVFLVSETLQDARSWSSCGGTLRTTLERHLCEDNDGAASMHIKYL